MSTPGRKGPDPRTGTERGAVLVEFVLVATILLFILFSMMEMAMLLNTKLVLSSAAREGARRAAIDGGATRAVHERIEKQLALGRLDADRAVVSVSPWAVSHGQSIRVRVQYPYETLTPFVRPIAGSHIPLQAEVIARSEKVR